MSLRLYKTTRSHVPENNVLKEALMSVCLKRVHLNAGLFATLQLAFSDLCSVVLDADIINQILNLDKLDQHRIYSRRAVLPNTKHMATIKFCLDRCYWTYLSKFNIWFLM